MSLPVFFAPLQGYTEDAYRRIHHELCGGVEEYCTPFLRVEHGEVRKKDSQDIRPTFNVGVPLALQFIAKDAAEMEVLLDAVKRQREEWQKVREYEGSVPAGSTWADAGRIRIDVNMGCPFPLQVRHGRGAGILSQPTRVREVCDFMLLHPECDFSVKMRLGVEGPDDWREVLPMLDEVPLRHVTLHPRYAAQQYKGEPDRGAFEAFLEACRHRVVYNGDVTSVSQIEDLEARYPQLAGVMVGRGLLARPTLAMEYKNGISATSGEVAEMLKRIHDGLLRHYAAHIPGEAQQLAKLRTFWDYAEPTIGHKAWKKIHKAGNMRNYLGAVGELRGS